MFRTKEDVDRNVHKFSPKSRNDKERYMRYYQVAKLYYNMKEWEIARRYVSNYLSVHEGSAGAHKLLGQVYERQGQKKQADLVHRVASPTGWKLNLIVGAGLAFGAHKLYKYTRPDERQIGPEMREANEDAFEEYFDADDTAVFRPVKRVLSVTDKYKPAFWKATQI